MSVGGSWLRSYKPNIATTFIKCSAYAATFGATQITTVLVYPMLLPTWQRLVERNRVLSAATIAVGGRVVRLVLSRSTDPDVKPGFDQTTNRLVEWLEPVGRSMTKNTAAQRKSQ